MHKELPEGFPSSWSGGPVTVKEANGRNGVTWKWLVGVLLTLVFAASGWAWISLASQVSDMQREVNSRAERLAIVETETRLLKEQLTRIERKLDVALQRP